MCVPFCKFLIDPSPIVIEEFERLVRAEKERTVELRKFRELPAEIVAFLPGQRHEPLHHGREHGIEPVLRRFSIEVKLGEAVHLGRGVDREPEQARLDLVQQVGSVASESSVVS